MEEKFEDFNLSQPTISALNELGYVYPTRIQTRAIKSALEGHDILGSAKTGSGKTLSFLIPMLEILTKTHYNKQDGIIALIIAPTRELAYQIFENLKKVGKNHQFSAGLIFGGKNVKDEFKYIQNINLLIATPGRLLQHMDENPLFNCLNLKLLIIDEADKLMELDFSDTIKSIFSHLPQERQTLLFSATLNQFVSNLATLSLKDPIIIDVHQDSKYLTPKKLNQFYLELDLHEKLNFIYSFIKTHLKCKILVFMSCCKQVRYIYHALCHMTPGTIVLSLNGSQKQAKRLEMYDTFLKKQSCVMFATDVASRGLDFPSIDWVIQYDISNDIQTYIHRVGRTARFNNIGNSLLLTLPQESKFIKLLNKYKIPISPLYIKDVKLMNIHDKLASYCAKTNENRVFAIACFVSYLKSIHLKKLKLVQLEELDLAKYSQSLGLYNIPELPFLSETNSNHIKVLSEESPIDDDFLIPSSNPTNIDIIEPSNKQIIKSIKKPKLISKAKAAKKLIKKGVQVNTKIKFSEA